MEDQTILASTQPNASLVVRQGAQVDTVFPLASSTVALGREEGVGITIQDPEVSRQHARISQQAGGYILEDLGSTNGTYLNGVQITGPQPLRPGDTIGLGQTALVFQQADTKAMPAQPTARPAPPPPSPAVELAEQQGRSRCLLWGCGCLVLGGLLLVAVAVAAMLLFGEEIQPIFDQMGIPIQLTMLYVTHLLA